jgi:Mg-chelatase subunit ChlD
MHRPTLIALALATLCRLFPPAAADGVGDPFGPVNRPGGEAPKGPAGEPPPPAIAALRPWLVHEDWVTRALAAREMSRRSEDGVVEALAAALARETDERVTLFLLKALAGRPRQDLLAEAGGALVDALLPLARDARPTIARRALTVLRAMPPLDLGDDPARYDAWWRKGREGLALEVAEAVERLAAARRGAARPGAGPTPDDSHTTPRDDRLEKFRALDRIHRDGLEVVVCLDDTGSMGDVIAEAKASVRRLLGTLRTLAPKFRAGLVTYEDGASVRIPLTTDDAAVEKELRKVEAGGGGDPEEGVDVAVLLALKQERLAWSRKAMRAICVVGDAPPHRDDLDRLYAAIEKARADDLYEVPIRVDTVSCPSSDDVDEQGYVAHFREIASRGRGTAVRLRSVGTLALELTIASFGPEWREAIRELLADLEVHERETAAKSVPARPSR